MSNRPGRNRTAQRPDPHPVTERGSGRGDPMRILELFAGVGMFSYGLHKLGWTTAAAVEIDPWCRRVWEKNYPGVKLYEDVRDVTAQRLIEDGIMANARGEQLEKRQHGGGTTGGRAHAKPPGPGKGGRSESVYETGNQSIDVITGGEDEIIPNTEHTWDEQQHRNGEYSAAPGSGWDDDQRRGRENNTGFTGASKDETDGWSHKTIDIITGGFPCQDLSVAGKQRGIDGERSGLWSEFARIISDVAAFNKSIGKPGPYVIIENVPALLSGSTVTWFCECGWVGTKGKHIDGEWLLSRDESDWQRRSDHHHGGEAQAHNQDGAECQHGVGQDGSDYRGSTVTNPGHPEPPGRNTDQGHDTGRSRRTQATDGQGQDGQSAERGEDATHTNREGLEGRSGHEQDRDQPGRQRQEQNGPACPEDIRPGQSDEGTGQPESSLGLLAHGIAAGLSGSRWLPEPGIGRVATGVPDRVNKLKALGNGLVWQIPYAIGAAIEELEARR